ncbi:Proline--tRNA ligase [compost metagenome]
MLYDDSDDRAGTKFATADLIGVPVQIIVGPRSAAAGEVEVKDRKTGAREVMTLEAALNRATG